LIAFLFVAHGGAEFLQVFLPEFRERVTFLQKVGEGRKAELLVLRVKFLSGAVFGGAAGEQFRRAREPESESRVGVSLPFFLGACRQGQDGEEEGEGFHEGVCNLTEPSGAG
jgi:hypothetical protein